MHNIFTGLHTHRTDAMGSAAKCEVLLDGGGTWSPYDDVLIIHTPGHTPGSLCVMVDTGVDTDTVLFSGDHIAYSASRKGLEGFK